MCRVFVIDDEKNHYDVYPHILEESGFEVFATENAFKLISYAPELKPELYVINSEMYDIDYNNLVEHLVINHFTDNAPLIVMYGNNEKFGHYGVSHYLHKPDEHIKLPQIAQAYCGGGGKYDILLIDDFTPSNTQKNIPINDLNISYFNVHDTKAAKKFIEKNTVNAVAVHCEAEKYEKIKVRGEKMQEKIVKKLERYKDTAIFSNAKMNDQQIKKYCKISFESDKMLRYAFEKMNLSARGYNRILRLLGLLQT